MIGAKARPTIITLNGLAAHHSARPRAQQRQRRAANPTEVHAYLQRRTTLPLLRSASLYWYFALHTQHSLVPPAPVPWPLPLPSSGWACTLEHGTAEALVSARLLWLLRRAGLAAALLSALPAASMEGEGAGAGVRVLHGTASWVRLRQAASCTLRDGRCARPIACRPAAGRRNRRWNAAQCLRRPPSPFAAKSRHCSDLLPAGHSALRRHPNQHSPAHRPLLAVDSELPTRHRHRHRHRLRLASPASDLGSYLLGAATRRRSARAEQ